MPEITVCPREENPNRVNLYLDDEFAFALSIDEVARQNLKKGLILTDEQITNLKEADQNEYVYAKILNFLSFRPRTIKEVRDRLKKYEVADKGIQDLFISRLKTNGYLDDIAFAQWFISSRNTHRPRSKRMLAQELASKGVGQGDISSVIGEVNDENDSIRRLLIKKLGEPRILTLGEKQKIGAYLGRLGYSWDDIKEVVKNWESE
jgi:regulatory protein